MISEEQIDAMIRKSFGHRLLDPAQGVMDDLRTLVIEAISFGRLAPVDRGTDTRDAAGHQLSAQREARERGMAFIVDGKHVPADRVFILSVPDTIGPISDMRRAKVDAQAALKGMETVRKQQLVRTGQHLRQLMDAVGLEKMPHWDDTYLGMHSYSTMHAIEAKVRELVVELSDARADAERMNWWVAPLPAHQCTSPKGGFACSGCSCGAPRKGMATPAPGPLRDPSVLKTFNECVALLKEAYDALGWQPGSEDEQGALMRRIENWVSTTLGEDSEKTSPVQDTPVGMHTVTVSKAREVINEVLADIHRDAPKLRELRRWHMKMALAARERQRQRERVGRHKFAQRWKERADEHLSFVQALNTLFGPTDNDHLGTEPITNIGDTIQGAMPPTAAKNWPAHNPAPGPLAEPAVVIDGMLVTDPELAAPITDAAPGMTSACGVCGQPFTDEPTSLFCKEHRQS